MFNKSLALLIQMLLTFLISISPCFSANSLSSSQKWWKNVSRPYAGKILHGVTEYTPSSIYVQKILAPEFEKLTGIKVNLETISWEEMYNKSIQDIATKKGLYDFIYIEQDIIYAYTSQNYLENITKLLYLNPKLKAPSFSFDDFNSFLNYFKDEGTGDVYGIPMEAFITTYMFRTDLFNDPKIKAVFKKKYGYSLRPAQTFKEFSDISAFFTDWGKKTGKELWGTTIQASMDHPASFYELFTTIFPSFGIYNWGINKDTWKSTAKNGGSLDSSEAKQAFKFWLSMLKYSPPETYGSTWDETILTLASGRIAHTWMAGENAVWLATDSKRSNITGKLGVALPPMAKDVEKNAKQGKGYIGYFDGGAFGLPQTSKQKEIALLWLQFIGQPSVQEDWALQTGRIVHKNTLNAARIKALDKKVGGYFSLLKMSGRLFAASPPFPFHAEIREVIAPFIYKAIRGKLTAEAALDLAALKVDEALLKLAKKGR